MNFPCPPMSLAIEFETKINIMVKTTPIKIAEIIVDTSKSICNSDNCSFSANFWTAMNEANMPKIIIIIPSIVAVSFLK